jgi:hypothetical protein
MGWGRIDDGLIDHPKFIELDDDLDAIGLWTLCLAWAHKTRRTAARPGFLPSSIVRRFGKGRSKRLANRLVTAGLWDEQGSEGWAIHDFADYLPKYDSEQARAAGAAGGKARAAKQTASKPLDEPLSGSPEDRQADSSTRASARRNPVPKPKPELHPGSPQSEPESLVTRGPTSLAGQIVVVWTEASRAAGVSPIGDQTTVVGRQAKELLEEGNEFALISEAAVLAATARKPWIADFVGPAVGARKAAHKWHDDKRNPAHSPPPAFDPYADPLDGGNS